MTAEGFAPGVHGLELDDLRWRVARLSDLPVALKILNEVTRWLAAREVQQWGSAPWVAQELEPSISDRTLFVAEASRVVGVVVVDLQADDDFWTVDERDHRASYLHHLAVARAAAGRNVGAWLLARAADAARAAGDTRLRLDAPRTNSALHDYYKSQGFVLVRTVNKPAGTAVPYSSAGSEQDPSTRHESAAALNAA